MDFGNIMGGQNPYAGQDTSFGGFLKPKPEEPSSDMRQAIMKAYGMMHPQAPGTTVPQYNNPPAELPIEYAPTEMTGWAPHKGGLNVGGGMPSYDMNPQTMSMMSTLLRNRGQQF